MCQFPVECIVLCWNCKFYMCALAGSSRLLGSQHVANNKRMKIGPFSYQYWVHVRRYIKTSEFYKIVNTAFHSICFLQHCCINDFLFWLEKEETFLSCYFIELDSIWISMKIWSFWAQASFKGREVGREEEGIGKILLVSGQKVELRRLTKLEDWTCTHIE